MTVKESIDQLLEAMPEPRQRQVLDFVRFLTIEEDTENWRQLGQASLAQAYGSSEPEYSLDDLRKDAR